MTDIAIPLPPKVTLWHNPECSKCRKTKELLEWAQCQVELYEYAAQSMVMERLREVLELLGKTPRDMVRKNEEPYAALGLDDADDEQLLKAMAEHPILIQRPIALARGKAVLCRPPEMALGLLTPTLPTGMTMDELMRRTAQGKI
jgi:arsenate reductase